MASAPESSDALARGLFRQYLELWYRGAEVDFDTWCAAQAAPPDALREWHARWREIMALLDELSPLMAPAERAAAEPGPARVAPPRFSQHDDLAELITRVVERSSTASRYTLGQSIARGGMGEILSVWDKDLRRQLAMKLFEDAAILRDGVLPDVVQRRLMRFLEEAQVTGQLDHPGIVPVHEFGLDHQGRFFFTMRLVKGSTLKDVFELLEGEHPDWSQTRVLSIMLKVCEAMAYAHSKGVIHRDLKPANVMVGRFGEVYVMDWGVARIIGHRDLHDLRLRAGAAAAQSAIDTARQSELLADPDSPILTMDGDIVGTPSYMAPEQARGHVDEISARADVYSVGAMLYQLLTGRMPYVPPNARISCRTVLACVLERPPQPILELNPAVPPELVAICEKAMARDPDDRYPHMQLMAEDLRAYLEHRVVKAYEAGPLAEFRKWMIRNRGTAVAMAAALFLTIAGLIAVGVVEARARRAADQLRESADQNASEARGYAAEARRNYQDVLRLGDVKELADLLAEVDQLWPEEPRLEPAMRQWLLRAEQLAAHRPDHQRTLDLWRAQGERIETHTGSGVRVTWRFADKTMKWWHDLLEQLVRDLERLDSADARVGAIAEIKERIHMVRWLEFTTLEEHADDWEAAIAAIADRTQCPQYRGLAIEPQFGLVPIGRDPESGLFEFACPRTGALPARGPDDRLVLGPDSALVLVLLPGGEPTLGCQAKEARGANYDPDAQVEDFAVHTVTLAPFFISKYEMTQGQWLAFVGLNPSNYQRFEAEGRDGFRRHPVEQVSLLQCEQVVARLGLALPTEAQWEYAARGGTASVWWTGNAVSSIEQAANIADQRWADAVTSAYRPELWLNDGYAFHAPVGSFHANRFGLHDVIGNVWEWCSGRYAPPYATPHAGDGARDAGDGEQNGVGRGGAYSSPSSDTRVAARTRTSADYVAADFGLRPIRRVVP
ncbi:MAG: bifunctional serine/threonine-protein kinase/formylglycine-generating enzyme family protein [Planctomycetota bacterium]